MENVEKWKFWFLKVLFLITYTRANLSTQYAHFYLICFYYQRPDFKAYTSLCLIRHKTDV